MSTPTPNGPDQGLHDVPPDQGLHDTSPDQGLTPVNHPTAPKSRTPLFVGIGAIVVVVAGIIAAIFH